MTELTRDQLASASPTQWRHWVKDGLCAFVRNRHTISGARSFLPLVVPPLGHNPAGALATEISELLRGKTSIAATAVSSVLSSWRIGLDGPQGAIMGIELATRLDAPGLGRICLRLIHENASMDEASTHGLIWCSFHAVSTRGTSAQLLALGRAVSRSAVWTPPLVAEFATLLGSSSLEDMPKRLLKAVPSLLAEPHTGQYARELAERLPLDFSLSELRSTLAQHARDNEDLARFRRILSDELGLNDESVGTLDPEGLENIIRRADIQCPPSNIVPFRQVKTATHANRGRLN